MKFMGGGGGGGGGGEERGCIEMKQEQEAYNDNILCCYFITSFRTCLLTKTQIIKWWCYSY
jgi:hypothetical protein